MVSSNLVRDVEADGIPDAIPFTAALAHYPSARGRSLVRVRYPDANSFLQD